MKNVLIAVIALFGVIFLILLFPSFITSVEDTQTDGRTEGFLQTTAGGVTNTSVTLSQDLWQGDTLFVTSVTSDVANDNPIASIYTVANNALLVIGLEASQTRNLTVDYLTDGLTQFSGMGQALPVFPLIALFAVISISLGAVLNAFKGRG